MSELSTYLREAREGQGISIEDISRTTKIQPRHIRAIEEGNWHLLPEPVYTRAFIRQIATYIGIDPQDAVSRYTEEVNPPGYGAPAFAPPKDTEGEKRGGGLFAGFSLKKGRQLPWMQWAYVVLFLALVGSAIYGFRAGTTPTPPTDHGNRTEMAAESSFGIEMPNITALELTDTAGDVTWLADASGDRGVGSSPSHISDVAGATRGTESEPGLAAAQDRADSKTVVLDVDVQIESWFDVIADGERIFIGAVPGGNHRRWEANERLSVTFGRPEDVYLTLNGIDIGVAGNGVITRHFTPDDLP